MLWQHLARVNQEARRYGPSARRHLRLSLLQAAAGNYDRAAREACLSIARGHNLGEARFALAAALLGQALVQEGLLEPGPGHRTTPAPTHQLVEAAAHAFRQCAEHNPADGEAAQLARQLTRAIAERSTLRDRLAALVPAGP